MRGGSHMLSEKSQRTQNGTMFVDLDWLLNESRRLSAFVSFICFLSNCYEFQYEILHFYVAIPSTINNQVSFNL